MNNEEQKRTFTWRSWKLLILDFGVFSISTGEDLFELVITTKEPGGIKTLSYFWEPEELEKFFKEIKEFDGQVVKVKNFKDRLVIFNCGEQKMQTSLYFKKEQWRRFYNFFEEAYKNYLDQKKIYAGF